MANESLTCPFCNTLLTSAATEAGRAKCPRCDEILPADVASRLVPRTSPVVAVEPWTVPGKGKTLAGVLGLMAGMAVLAASFALWTQDFRRQNDHKKGAALALATTQTPGEMMSLGFIPARCNIVAGVNLVDLRANPVAKKALLEAAPKPIAWLSDRLRETTTLTLDDLDQVAVGIEMTDKLPKIFVILQTRGPYVPQAILKPLTPAKSLQVRNRPAVRFPLSQVGEGVVWCLSERQVALMFSVEPGPLDDLESIPVRPREKLEGSSERVRSLVQEHVDKQSLAWLAADVAAASGLRDFLSLVNARLDSWQPLLKSRAVTLSMTAERDVKLFAQFLGESTTNGADIGQSLGEMNWHGTTKIQGPPTEAGQDPWVLLQVRLEAEGLGVLLAKGPGKK